MPAARRSMRRTSRRTARRTSRRVSRRQGGGDEYYDEGEQGYEPAPEPSKYDELEKLTNLHTQGALTDAEFEAEKKKLLG